MIADENDVLEHTLARNSTLVDAFYVLDGSEDHKTANEICWDFDNCAGYWRDEYLPKRYPRETTDGCRQFIYNRAGAECGYDHWFLLLHGDEFWTFDPQEVIDRAPDADGFVFRLPFAFPRYWDPAKSAADQLSEFMVPGWPEFRMFRGGHDVQFNPEVHFSVTPQGLHRIYQTEKQILHYLYRAPGVQYDRAAKRRRWSPENWQELEARGPFWDDHRISEFCRSSQHYGGTMRIAA